MGSVYSGGLVGKAMAGLGTGLAVAGLDAFRAQLLAARAAQLNEYETQSQQRGFTQQTSERVAGEKAQTELETNVKQPFQKATQERGFTQEQMLQANRYDFEREQNKLKATLTREEIASREKIATANEANALKIAQVGGTVQQDKEGNLLFFDKSGSPTQIMDPNNPGKPLQGYKDLTPAAKAYADVIKSQLVGLDKEEVAALDPSQQSQIQSRRAILNIELLNVLTGGISGVGKSAPAGGKTGWDSATGQVFVAGEVIGNAANEAEARKLAAGAKGGELSPDRFTKTPPAQKKKDPLTGESLTKQEWERKYGAGSWNK